MPVLLEVVAPVFGLVVLGFAAARLRILHEAGIKGLVDFVFSFAIPVLLLRSTARLDLPEDIPWSFLVAFYGGAFTTWALGMASARWLFHRGPDEGAIFGMAAGYSNTVLMGIPIVLTAFGPAATLPLFLIIATHSTLLMPLTLAALHWSRRGRASLGAQGWEVARAVVLNPIVLGLVAGLAMNLLNLAFPRPVDRTLELLGSAAVPCALFALGAAVAGYPLGGDMRPAAVLSALKLCGHPLLVWVVGGTILGIEGLWLSVAVVVASMPTGVNVYLFSARYSAASEVAARTVLLASLASVVTISTLLLVLAG